MPSSTWASHARPRRVQPRKIRARSITSMFSDHPRVGGLHFTVDDAQWKARFYPFQAFPRRRNWRSSAVPCRRQRGFWRSSARRLGPPPSGRRRASVRRLPHRGARLAGDALDVANLLAERIALRFARISARTRSGSCTARDAFRTPASLPTPRDARCQGHGAHSRVQAKRVSWDVSTAFRDVSKRPKRPKRPKADIASNMTCIDVRRSAGRATPQWRLMTSCWRLEAPPSATKRHQAPPSATRGALRTKQNRIASGGETMAFAACPGHGGSRNELRWRRFCPGIHYSRERHAGCGRPAHDRWSERLGIWPPQTGSHLGRRQYVSRCHAARHERSEAT